MAVEVEVKSQLTKIVDDLTKISKASRDLSGELSKNTENVGTQVKKQTKQVEQYLDSLKSFGRRTADQLRQDFAALASVTSLAGGLKLSQQFAGSAKEAVLLSDTVRRFGSVFGIAQSQFSSFQALLTKGLGEIGASSEAAANALKGLAETPVRGQKNLLEYAKAAAELASISGEKGQEGSIAKGAAGIITSRGGNSNDLGQLNAVTKEILQIRQATGKSVTEITSALSSLYAGANHDFLKRLQGGGSTTLATASLMGGPQATSFIENFLGKNKYSRLGQEAQGFKDILGSNGSINSSAVASILKEAKGRGMGDAQAGLTTMGLGDDEAKGFIRLAEALKQNEAAINGARTAQVNLNDEYRKSMSLGDSFRASINRVKGMAAPLVSGATQGLTSLLGQGSQSTGGALAVTGGSALLAAVLTGGGLRGLGGLLGGEMKAKAIQAATGEHVEKVEVINWPTSMSGAWSPWSPKGLPGTGGIAAAGEAAGGIGALGTAGLAAAAVGVGLLAGKAATYVGQGGAEDDLKSLFSSMRDFFMGKNTPGYTGTIPLPAEPRVRVKVELNKPELKASVRPGRSSQ